MIESYVVSKLDTITALSGQIYPTAAPVGDCTPPFAIYTVMTHVPTRDMAQKIAFYTDTVRIDLYHDDYDALCAMAAGVEKLLTLQCEDLEYLYIFSCSASGGDPDGFDLTMELHRKTLLVTVRYWMEVSL